MSYEVADDRARLDVALIHRFLSEESYWARGRSREEVERSLEHSICFGAYADAGGEQVGFARVVSDRSTFAWLADVFVVEGHRGRGIGKQLVQATLDHPELRGVYRWFLATADAHGLYRAFGYDELRRPERFLAIEPERLASLCADG